MNIHPESLRQFPWLTKTIPDSMLSEERAIKFHGQTLQRLNERDGLAVGEILLNLNIFSEWADYTRAIDSNREPTWMARVLEQLIIADSFINGGDRKQQPKVAPPAVSETSQLTTTTKLSNTASHAVSELALLSRLANKGDGEGGRPLIEPFADEIIALCERFGRSGQSGGSAPYTAGAISEAVKKLMLFKPIAPLSGEDDEWADINQDFLQNNRYGSIFKMKTGKHAGRSYFLDAVIFRNQFENMYSASAKLGHGEDKALLSRQWIKKFPFSPPAPIVVDVLETEVEPEYFEFTIITLAQLDRVSAEYDLCYNTDFPTRVRIAPDASSEDIGTGDAPTGPIEGDILGGEGKPLKN